MVYTVIFVFFKLAGINTDGLKFAGTRGQLDPQLTYTSHLTDDMVEFDKEMEVFTAHAQEVARLVPAYRTRADRVQIKLMTEQANDLAEENEKISRKCQDISANDHVRDCLKLLKKLNDKAQSFVNFLQR